MLIVRKLPELIDYLNSALGNDMTYLCTCMLTDYNLNSLSPKKNLETLERVIDMPIEFRHSGFDLALDVASGYRR